MTCSSELFDWLVTALCLLCSDESGFEGSLARQRLQTLDGEGVILLLLINGNPGLVKQRGLTLVLRLLLLLLRNSHGTCAKISRPREMTSLSNGLLVTWKACILLSCQIGGNLPALIQPFHTSWLLVILMLTTAAESIHPLQQANSN